MKKKIKFAEFNLLNIQEKAEIIKKEGWLVITEKTKTQIKTLYQINDFYTEVVFLYIKLHGNLYYVKRNSVLFSVVAIMYIGNEISTYRKNEALKIIDGIPIKSISFKYNNSVISTSRVLLYVGQTQSSIFLYNRMNASTTVYNMSQVDSLNVDIITGLSKSLIKIK